MSWMHYLMVMSQTPIAPPDFAKLRIEYIQHSLSENDVLESPIQQFVSWLHEAIAAQANEPNAFTLATATLTGIPSARIVLLKHVENDGITFFTNYLSRKGHELAANPLGAALFYWPELERQVRFEGRIEKTSRQMSIDYFNQRPPAARIGSAASPQSKPLSSREQLEDLERRLQEKYPAGDVPCPEHWGGYTLRATRAEFWQGRHSRLHDRVEYNLIGGKWTRQRLAP